MSAGYGGAEYAGSLAEFGSPRALPHSGGWLLDREIDSRGWRDAASPYPLFVCDDWDGLRDDFQDIGEELVTVTLVSDPFAAGAVRAASGMFDHFVPFKEHTVIDLRSDPFANVSAHHRRYARRAMRELEIERVAEPVTLLDDWVRLYDHLVQRRRITGIRAFSRAAFERQLRMPSLAMFAASDQGETVAMLLWYVADGRAYYHLGASNSRGYELHASFGLYWRSIEWLAEQGVEQLTLGAGAGVSPESGSGLADFKRGWSTATLPVYICGKVLDRAKYDALPIVSPRFFPPYRATAW